MVIGHDLRSRTSSPTALPRNRRRFYPGTTVITATESSTPPITGTLTLTVVTGTTHYAYVSNVTDDTISVYNANVTTSPYLTEVGSPVNYPPVLPETDDPASQRSIRVRNRTSRATARYTLLPMGYLRLSQASQTPLAVLQTGTTESSIPTVGSSSISIPGMGRAPIRTARSMDSRSTRPMAPHGGSPARPFTTNLSSGRSLIIDHTGQYLYATNNGNNTISAYQINQSTGALTPLSTGATIPTGTGPEIATLDPTGTHLYVANKTANSVSSYSIGAGGALTSLGPDTVVTGAVSVINVKVAPNGSYLYVLDVGNPTATPAVAGALYGLPSTSGVPGTTPISGTPVATEVAPTDIAIDPTSSLIAVDNSGSNAISLFTIGTGGALTSQTPVATGNLPLFVTFLNTPQ